MRAAFAVFVSVVLAGCALMGVRKVDLDAWVGVPVEALDTHSLFLTVPMVRTVTSSGIEIRNYMNGETVASCSTSGSGTTSGGYVNSSAFAVCSSNKVVCNNLFYIKDGKVLEYAPTGSCYTNETVQPQARWKRLQQS